MARRTNAFGVPVDDEDEEERDEEEAEGDDDGEEERYEDKEEAEGDGDGDDDLGEMERELESLQRTRAAARDVRTRSLVAVATALRALADALEQLGDDGAYEAPLPTARARAREAEPAPPVRVRRTTSPEGTVSERVLALLEKRREPMAATDIAAALGEDKAAVRRRVWELSRKLLVRKVSHGVYEAVKS